MNSRFALGLAGSLLVLIAAAIACGSEEEAKVLPPGDDAATGGDDASVEPEPDAWTQCPEDGRDGLLAVETPSTTMKVELGVAGQTLQFVAKKKSTGQIVQAIWSLSAPDVGSIDGSGLFTASGRAGGAVKITARYQDGRGSAELDIRLHAEDGAAAVTAQEKATLIAKGSELPDPNWKIVYPNDKTIFPGGTLPPEIHSVESALAPTKYYVHITAPHFDYEGFFPVQGQLVISQPAWAALTSTAQGGTATVEIAKLVGTKKYGPKTQTWQVARGTMHGSVFYSTYDSPLAGGNGAVMRIKGNSAQPEIVAGNCTVCHSISRDGTTLAAANHAGAKQGGIFSFQTDAGIADGGPALVNVWPSPEVAAFAGLSPTGDVFVVNGAPGTGWPPNTPGTSAMWKSSLLMRDGGAIADSGIESYYAQTPSFSADGKLLAFVDREAVSPWKSKLAMMHYDAATRQFSGYEVLATPPAGRHFSWPTFSPDGKFIVYQDGVGDDLATWATNTGKLWAINVQTKAVTPLTRLNGDGAMPGGARDEDLNFLPSFAPVTSGGYSWLIFTSRRTYGNRLTGTRDETKRLWAAALDVDIKEGVDPSHPAFYVSGQELKSGNSRGNWVLDPCKSTGSSCGTGDECCDGYCSADPEQPGKFACGAKTACCAHEFDKCTTSADCCQPSLGCVGGRCALVQP